MVATRTIRAANCATEKLLRRELPEDVRAKLKSAEERLP